MCLEVGVAGFIPLEIGSSHWVLEAGTAGSFSLTSQTFDSRLPIAGFIGVNHISYTNEGSRQLLMVLLAKASPCRWRIMFRHSMWTTPLGSPLTQLLSSQSMKPILLFRSTAKCLHLDCGFYNKEMCFYPNLFFPSHCSLCLDFLPLPVLLWLFLPFLLTSLSYPWEGHFASLPKHPWFLERSWALPYFCR